MSTTFVQLLLIVSRINTYITYIDTYKHTYIPTYIQTYIYIRDHFLVRTAILVCAQDGARVKLQLPERVKELKADGY